MLRENGRITAMESAHACTLLIVDDDPFISDLLTRKFVDAGFNTVHANNGAEAMKRLEDGQVPDSILLDLMMPVMNGYEVLAHLQEKPEWAKIPVIVLSNVGSEEDIARAKKLGAKECLLKIDVPLDEVVARILAVCPNPAH